MGGNLVYCFLVQQCRTRTRKPQGPDTIKVYPWDHSTHDLSFVRLLFMWQPCEFLIWQVLDDSSLLQGLNTIFMRPQYLCLLSLFLIESFFFLRVGNLVRIWRYKNSLHEGHDTSGERPCPWDYTPTLSFFKHFFFFKSLFCSRQPCELLIWPVSDDIKS